MPGFRRESIQPGLRQGEIGVVPEQPSAARRDVGLLEQPVGIGEHGGRAGGGGEPGHAVQQVGFRARVLRCGQAAFEQRGRRGPVANLQQDSRSASLARSPSDPRRSTASSFSSVRALRLPTSPGASSRPARTTPNAPASRNSTRELLMPSAGDPGRIGCLIVGAGLSN